MSDVLVTCVTKPDRNSSHEHITHLGGTGWTWPVRSVIEAIEARTYTFYTEVGGKRADIAVNDRNGKKFVQTHADGYWNNNLLSLNACPIR